MTKQTGFRVKIPYDNVLEKIIKGKKKKVNRLEKSYFVALQNREMIKIMEFKGLEVMPKIAAARRRRYTKASRFDIDVYIY
tara:strand:+ start:170 stop:412 length:243 start_codon:yes stop_codon:yes gene_type:complete